MDAPRDRNDFSVAVLCALPLEAECMLALFDYRWNISEYSSAHGDLNAYTLGAIGIHNVVIVHMPSIGTVSAAGVAAHLQMSFPYIQLVFVTGICGGIPTSGDAEIVLGDVIISSSLVQYDFGKEYPGGFQIRSRTEDTLNRASPQIRSSMNRLRTAQYLNDTELHTRSYLQKVHERLSTTRDPGPQDDYLFDPAYLHKHHNTGTRPDCPGCQVSGQICQEAIELSCRELGCDKNKLVHRSRLKATDVLSSSADRPSVFFASLASGNKVMKSAVERDRLAQQLGVRGFEMEGAGVWDYIPTLVVKGVADYADSHKSKKFQRFAAATAASCTKALITGLSTLQTKFAPGATPRPVIAWTIPFTGLSEMVGRKSEIEALKAKLFETTAPKQVALVGPAGVGKTRLALECASMARANSSSVFWVQGTDRLAVEQDFRGIGKAMNIHGISEDSANVKLLVHLRLRQPSAGNWLFILDNADDEALWGTAGSLVDYLPRCEQGSILITTRTRRVGFQLAGTNLLELSPMQENDALALFERRVGRHEARSELSKTADLVKKLSYFPLAIVQAAAYMFVNGNSTAEYLQLMQDSEENVAELLDEGFQVNGRYPDSVSSILSTWTVSFDQIRRQSQLAASYISFMCCLNANHIPKWLLSPGPSPKKMNDAIGTLKAYYLIYEQESQYGMHNLVRLATRNWLRTEERLYDHTAEAIDRLLQVSQPPTIDNRHIWQPCLAHMDTLCKSEVCDDQPTKYLLIHRLAKCYYVQGKNKEARDKLEQAAAWFKHKFGKEDQRVCDIHLTLGTVYSELGMLPQAEKVLQEVYDQNVEMLGMEHLKTISAMAALTKILYKSGQYDKAESLAQDTVRLRTAILGVEHPDTLNSVRDLAWVYQEQEQHETAVTLLENILEVIKSRSVPDVMLNMSVSNDLSVVYDGLGRHDEAETVQTEALRKSHDLLGDEHPFTVMQMHSLSAIYFSQKRYTEAEHVILKVIEFRENTLGKDSVYLDNCRWLLDNIRDSRQRDVSKRGEELDESVNEGKD